MGKLLSILKGCPNRDEDVFVDFERAEPTEGEQQTYEKVSGVLGRAEDILKDLTGYRGAALEIREAINNPHDEEKQAAAWSAVSALVLQLRDFYLFSKELHDVAKLVLGELASPERTPMEHLEEQQALFRQFAEILDFTLRFDETKMSTPALQNDFAYYRRKSGQMASSGSTSSASGEPQANGASPSNAELEITNELGGHISMFLAESRPMMKVLSDATSRFVTENKDVPLENTTDCLGKMAAICRVMIENPEYRARFESDSSRTFVLRVMVGVIILYDQVHPSGAFVRGNGIEIEKAVKVLKVHAPPSANLVDALKFTTRNFNSAPDSVKKAFS